MTTGRKPHVHAEVIKAWADGADVQFAWDDPSATWIDTDNPAWEVVLRYRVKPQPKPEPKTWYQVVFRGECGDIRISQNLHTKVSADAVFPDALKLIPIYTEGEETE